MYTMMNTTGWDLSFILFYGLHMLSIVVFAFGAAFLLFWAFKHLSERKLWQWGWALAVIGTIACLLTLPAWPWFATGGFGGMGYNTGGMSAQNMQMMGQMMERMMEHNGANPDAEHDEIEGMMRDVIRGTGNNQGMMQ